MSLEEQNEKLLKTLNIKEEELRNTQVNYSKTYELTNKNDTIISKVSIEICLIII
jgi:hypothetical protein